MFSWLYEKLHETFPGLDHVHDSPARQIYCSDVNDSNFFVIENEGKCIDEVFGLDVILAEQQAIGKTQDGFAKFHRTELGYEKGRPVAIPVGENKKEVDGSRYKRLTDDWSYFGRVFVGIRNDTFFRYFCFLRAMGIVPSLAFRLGQYWNNTLNYPSKECDKLRRPLDESELRSCWLSSLRYVAGTLDGKNYTVLGECVKRRHGKSRYMDMALLDGLGMEKVDELYGFNCQVTNETQLRYLAKKYPQFAVILPEYVPGQEWRYKAAKQVEEVVKPVEEQVKAPKIQQVACRIKPTENTAITVKKEVEKEIEKEPVKIEFVDNPNVIMQRIIGVVLCLVTFLFGFTGEATASNYIEPKTFSSQLVTNSTIPTVNFITQPIIPISLNRDIGLLECDVGRYSVVNSYVFNSCRLTGLVECDVGKDKRSLFAMSLKSL
jgi:hypothetical protein